MIRREIVWLGLAGALAGACSSEVDPGPTGGAGGAGGTGGEIEDLGSCPEIANTWPMVVVAHPSYVLIG